MSEEENYGFERCPQCHEWGYGGYHHECAQERITELESALRQAHAQAWSPDRVRQIVDAVLPVQDSRKQNKNERDGLNNGNSTDGN